LISARLINPQSAIRNPQSAIRNPQSTMPLTFPSHQGLILPLWRRFPARIDGVALCVGAAMPDIVDGAAWPFRGQLGQWLGHSLLGVILSVPAGIVLARIARRIGPRWMIARLDRGAPSWPGILREGSSVGIGALSHLAFDLITHGNFLLLWPWHESRSLFPSWWYHSWGAVPLPVYRDPYPIAPHTIAWLVLTVIGAWLFFRCLREKLKVES
jgi:uncharacterized protein DUF4184